MNKQITYAPDELKKRADRNIEIAKQFLVNATLKGEEFASPQFRHQQVLTAIEALKRAASDLATQAALEKASQV